MELLGEIGQIGQAEYQTDQARRKAKAERDGRPPQLLAELSEIARQEFVDPRIKLAEQRKLYVAMVRRAEAPEATDARAMIDLLKELGVTRNDLRDDLLGLRRLADVEEQLASACAVAATANARFQAAKAASDAATHKAMMERYGVNEQAAKQAGYAAQEAMNATEAPAEQCRRLNGELAEIRIKLDRIFKWA